LPKYNERVTKVVDRNCTIIFDSDRDFGVMPTLQFNDQPCDFGMIPTFQLTINLHVILLNRILTKPLQTIEVDEIDEFGDVLNSRSFFVLMHDSDDVRADRSVDSSLPRARIDRSKFMHLSDGQQQELLQLIDEFGEWFDETLGFCPYVEHITHTSLWMLTLNRAGYGNIAFPRLLNQRFNARWRNF
jgi:hypothetical protein